MTHCESEQTIFWLTMALMFFATKFNARTPIKAAINSSFWIMCKRQAIFCKHKITCYHTVAAFSTQINCTRVRLIWCINKAINVNSTLFDWWSTTRYKCTVFFMSSQMLYQFSAWSSVNFWSQKTFMCQRFWMKSLPAKVSGQRSPNGSNVIAIVCWMVLLVGSRPIAGTIIFSSSVSVCMYHRMLSTFVVVLFMRSSSGIVDMKLEEFEV